LGEKVSLVSWPSLCDKIERSNLMSPNRNGLRCTVGAVVFGVCAGICTGGASGAPAPDDDVDAIVKKGAELRRQGRDREALTEFKRAAAIRETPRVTAQIALAEQALGLWVDAETHLKKALEQSGDPWIRKNRTVLESALAVIAGHVGTIEVWGTPDGAEVLVDGKVAGVLPLVAPIRVAREDVPLQIRSPGYEDLVETLHVKSGSLIREHVELRLAPTAIATQGPLPPRGTTQGTLVSSRDTSEAGVDQRPVYSRWWFWTAIAAVAVGAGATFLLINRGGGSGDSCADPTRCTSTWR
jgi:hypothetical protein